VVLIIQSSLLPAASRMALRWRRPAPSAPPPLYPSGRLSRAEERSGPRRRPDCPRVRPGIRGTLQRRGGLLGADRELLAMVVGLPDLTKRVARMGSPLEVGCGQWLGRSKSEIDGHGVKLAQVVGRMPCGPLEQRLTRPRPVVAFRSRARTRAARRPRTTRDSTTHESPVAERWPDRPTRSGWRELAQPRLRQCAHVHTRPR